MNRDQGAEIEQPAATEVTEESEPAPAEEYLGGAASRWRPPRGYIVAVALLMAAGVGLAAISLALSNRLDDDDEAAVRRTSAQFGTALLTYDHGKLDQTKERVLSFATGAFKKQYEQAFAGGLDVLLQETEAQSRVTNLDVFLGEIDEESASSIVVVDTVTEGKSGTRRTLATYVRLELVRVAGAWKVDGVINLNFGLPEGQPAPAVGTPTPPASE